MAQGQLDRRELTVRLALAGAGLAMPSGIAVASADRRPRFEPVRWPELRIALADGRTLHLHPEDARLELRNRQGRSVREIRSDLERPVAATAVERGFVVVEAGRRFLRLFGADGEPGRPIEAGPERFNSPRDVATRGGILAVADVRAGQVRLFDDVSFRPIGTLRGRDSDPLNGPCSVAIDAGARFHVAELGSASIRVFDAIGTEVGRYGGRGFGEGSLSSVRAVRIDSAGDAWVADPVAAALVRFDPDGRFVERERPKLADGRPGAPFALSIGPERAFVTLRAAAPGRSEAR